MEPFIDQLAEKIAECRVSIEKEGISGELLTEKTREYTNNKLTEYYTKLMEIMSEADYQVYRKALEENDLERVQGIIDRYQDAIYTLQQELLEKFI